MADVPNTNRPSTVTRSLGASQGVSVGAKPDLAQKAEKDARAAGDALTRFIVAHPKTASALALAIGYVLGWITHW